MMLLHFLRAAARPFDPRLPGSRVACLFFRTTAGGRRRRECWREALFVDEEEGAGIELAPVEGGMLLTEIFDFPGQAARVGSIGGRSTQLVPSAARGDGGRSVATPRRSRGESPGPHALASTHEFSSRPA